MECNCGARVPSTLRNCPLCGRLIHPDVPPTHTHFPAGPRYRPSRQRTQMPPRRAPVPKAPVDNFAPPVVCESPPRPVPPEPPPDPRAFVNGRIGLQRAWRRVADRGSESGWEFDELVLVSEASKGLGRRKELFRSLPLPSEVIDGLTPKVRDVLDDFRDHLEVMGREEVRGHRPKFWYDHRYQRARAHKR